MLNRLHIRGYRSLREFSLSMEPLTVVVGQNGVGKSNFYRSLALLQRMAEGRFAEAVAAEGGMPKVMWGGDRRKSEFHGLSWKLEHSDFEFSMECGLVPLGETMSSFRTDPDIKIESLKSSPGGREIAKRKGSQVSVRNDSGKMEVWPLPLTSAESMLSEIRDAISSPFITMTREALLAWRFYHQFRTDSASSMRRPQVGFWSPVLANDGSNLAATLESIWTSDKADELDEVIAKAFPEVRASAVSDDGQFQLSIEKPHIRRPFSSAELSDGTLRFFCLCAALLTPRLPPLLVLNEPEASLHSDLVGELADLICRVPESTQMIVVTHSHELAAAICEQREARVVELVTYQDETRLKENATAKRAWTFGA